jgi:hypothetical protein
MTCCAIVMQATSSSLVSQVNVDWLGRCAAACSTQLRRDVAPLWGTAIDGVRVSNGQDLQPGEMVFAIVDALPDAPGAIAYHDVQGNAVPVAYLALSTCNTLDDVSTAISHELCETDGDEDCNEWCDDGQGHEFARELCDAVESNSYPIDLGDGQPPIRVSDFLLPAFFEANAPGPYNFCATIANDNQPRPSAPFATASGGYQIERDSGSNEQQVQGATIVHLFGTPRAARRERMKHWSSRATRRGWNGWSGSNQPNPPPATSPKAGDSPSAWARRTLEDSLEDSRKALEELRAVEESITRRTHGLEANVLRLVRLWIQRVGDANNELEKRATALEQAATELEQAS